LCIDSEHVYFDLLLVRGSTSVALLSKFIINRTKLNKLNKQSNFHMQIVNFTMWRAS